MTPEELIVGDLFKIKRSWTISYPEGSINIYTGERPDDENTFNNSIYSFRNIKTNGHFYLNADGLNTYVEKI